MLHLVGKIFRQKSVIREQQEDKVGDFNIRQHQHYCRQLFFPLTLAYVLFSMNLPRPPCPHSLLAFVTEYLWDPLVRIAAEGGGTDAIPCVNQHESIMFELMQSPLPMLFLYSTNL